MSDDEEMRKLLKPALTEDEALHILKTSYAGGSDSSKTCNILSQLDSYDDVNYKVEINDELFLLKIHNGVESNDFLKVYESAGRNYYKKDHAGSVIHLQNAILDVLQQENIPSSVPVKPVDSQDAPVSIHSLPVLSKKHSPAQLVVRLLKWVEGRPMSTISMLPLEALANAGRFLGKLSAALDQVTPDDSHPLAMLRRTDSERLRKKLTSTGDDNGDKNDGNENNNDHIHDASLTKAARRFHQWDGKHTRGLRKFTHCILNEKRRDMVESVIDTFQKELIETRVSLSFRKSIIHGDFNDANIMVDHDLHVCGVIDFGDSVESWKVLDISVAMTYAMLSTYGKANRSISAAAAMLRGYNSVHPLSDTERKYLVLLIACRLSCSCTLGAFSYQQNPGNEYLLLHSEPAWKALELIWGHDAKQRASLSSGIDRVFQQACLYTDSRDKVITCYDLVMPDPTVADLLQQVRIKSIYDTQNTTSEPEKKKRKMGTSSNGNRVITFVTGNPKKLEKVKRILEMDGSASSYQLIHKDLNLPELQGEALNIAREKCFAAAEKVGGPVIVEDTSLCFNALNGMPGVFIKWFLDSCGHEGLNRMIADYDDKTAFAQTVVAFATGPGEEPALFDGRTVGKIVMPRGKLEFGWDPIFEPDEGGGKTYAEMSKEAKDAISHRSRAFSQLRAYLNRIQSSNNHS